MGDSRCVASIEGIADPLSTDHKPCDPLEKERIISAGGFVELNRVNGNLALSRAVGDFAFKQNMDIDPEDQIVSGCPDVVSRSVSESWEFMVLACDGIWDVLSNQVMTFSFVFINHYTALYSDCYSKSLISSSNGLPMA